MSDDIPMSDVVTRQPGQNERNDEATPAAAATTETPNEPSSIGLGPLKRAKKLKVKQKIRLKDICGDICGCEVRP